MTPTSRLAFPIATLSLWLGFAPDGAAEQKQRELSAEEAVAAAGGGMDPRDFVVPDVPDVDMSKLDADQKRRAFALLSSQKCNCGCGFTLYNCRLKDETCPVGPGLAQGVVDAVLAGKTDDQIIGNLQAGPVKLVEAVEHEFDLSEAPGKGPADARVTLVEFSDFQCSVCALAQTWLPDLLAAYPDDLRLVYKHFPLTRHPYAIAAAEAAAAAQDQGKFWELHDKMYSDVRSLSPGKLKEWAREIGLDLGRFQASMDEDQFRSRIENDKREGQKAGVRGTPTYFVNGKRLLGRPSFDTIKAAIDAELAAAAP